MAAGSLLIAEAGGMTSDFDGGRDYLNRSEIVCGNPKIHEQLLKLLRSARAPQANDGSTA
jgi:myo-inositol-1(or 4)-monophosphatase